MDERAEHLRRDRAADGPQTSNLEEAGTAQVSDVAVHSELWVERDTQVSNRFGGDEGGRQGTKCWAIKLIQSMWRPKP